MEKHPSNGCVYAAGSGKLRAYKVAADGMLEEFSSADALGNPAHFCLSADGAWALCANYSASTLSVLPIAADGSVGAATDSKHHEAFPRPFLDRSWTLPVGGHRLEAPRRQAEPAAR